jgi:hypothetical protein
MFSSEPSLTLSIIIVSYNTAALTVQAINSVIQDIKDTKALEGQVELIVIDNHSSDETVTQLKKIQQKNKFLTIITNKKNLGFAGANNIGIKKTRGKYILLLNSDTTVKPGTLIQLVHTFEENPVDESTASLTSRKGKLDKLGILATVLLNEDGTIQPQGGSLPSLFTLFAQMFSLDDLPLIGRFFPTIQETGKAARLEKYLLFSTKKTPIQQGWVAGTAMCIKRSVIEDIGLLDANIFMYGEDIEFCIRAKKHHWDIAIDPLAKVIHLGSASSSSENAILGEFKAYLYIWAKHKPHWQIFFAKMILYFGARLRIFVFGTILRDKTRSQTYQKAKNLLD